MDTAYLLPALSTLLLGIVTGVIVARFLKKRGYVRIWPNRASVEPRLEQRFQNAKKSIFLYGLSFEGTLNSHKDDLVQAIQRGVEVKILMLHYKSKHVEAHQEFSDRTLKPKLEENVVLRLHDLFYESLTEDDRARLTIRATNYLPRFSANILDDKDLYINFYLYKSSASDNPVILINDRENPAEFKKTKKTLDALFDDPDNVHITQNGTWKGFDKEVK